MTSDIKIRKRPSNELNPLLINEHSITNLNFNFIGVITDILHKNKTETLMITMLSANSCQYLINVFYFFKLLILNANVNHLFL